MSRPGGGLGRRISTRDQQAFREEDVNPASYMNDDATFGASTIRTDDEPDDVARLYVICEMAMPRPDDPSPSEMTPQELVQRQEHLEETWELIREWLTAHPNPDERNMAATHLGQFSATALHLLCKLPDPPADIVEALIGCSPETVTWQDSNGWLPLHHACANGASGRVLSILCRSYPEGKVTQDRRQRTPLHFAFFRSDVGAEEDGAELDGAEGSSMAEIIRILSDTGAAKLPDEGGMLPMHYACAYGTTAPVLEVLEQAFPASTSARERKGRTPLHLAMVNAHRSAGPGVVRFLLDNCPKEVVDMTDDSGYLPLHLLAMVSKSRPDKPEDRANATECLKSYLDAGPRATAEFLQAIQSLPEWLRDHAVTSSHVHRVLNDKIVQRFPTSILISDFYVLILLIVVFSINARWHINYRLAGDPIPSNWPLYLQFVGGAYFLSREIAQVVSMAALGTFRKWLFDPENWLDMTVIFLVFYYAVLMVDPDMERGVSNELFQSGIAITQGVLYTDIIIYIKSTYVDFAVFVGGVVYVFRQLLAFMVSLAVILFAFAQMFYYVFSMTPLCPRNETTGELKDAWEYANPHCTFKRSLLKTYTMMMGEIGDVTLYYRENLVSQILYVLYAFLVVILLSNILIAIVVDSYGVIKNERAAMVFWSNRLDFVAEMDAISNSANLICTFGACRGDSGAPGAPMHVQEVPEGEAIATSESWRGGVNNGLAGNKNDRSLFKDGWSSIMSLFDPNLYKDNDITPGSFDFWCYFLLRFVAIIFIIPLWIIAGLVTAGWLWPPQVRELLFVQSRAAISRADIAEGVRNEVLKLKDELKGLRVHLKSEMKTDRKEMANMKTEVNAVQDDIISDLLQVKDIMKTLLELTREKKREREERASAALLAAARQ